MKILLLSNEYPPYVSSGPGVHVEYLSKELSKTIEVEVRTFHDQDITDEKLSVFGFNSKYKNYDGCLPPLKKPLQALSTCIDFNGIKGINADIIHCHTSDTFLGGILAKILYKIPLILTVHTLEIRRPWRKEHFGVIYDFYLWVEKQALEMADKIIAVSTSVKEDILKMFPNIPEDKVVIIQNGIDVDEYKETVNLEILEKYGIDVNRPYVLFIGALARQKGLQYLLEASKYLDKDLQLVICTGLSENQEIYKETVEKINEINETRGGIIFIDKTIPRNECINLYSSATVFCCPSIYEPFGLINLEAMACSTPIVASSIGGIREVLMQGEGGFLVEPGLSPNPPFEPYDIEGFSKRMSDAINRLVSDKNLRKRMGQRGRDRVVNNFSWEKVVEKTLALYKGVLDS